MGYPAPYRSKQLGAVKQYTSFLFPAPNLLGLLMDMNVPKAGFQALSQYISRRELHTRPQRVIRSPSPSPHGTRSQTRERRWPSPLSCRLLCPLRIPPQVAAHGRCNFWRATSNHGLHLRMSSIGCGLSYSSCAGMCTNVPVVVRPNSPLGSSTMPREAAHPRTCGLLGGPCAETTTWRPLQPFGPRTCKFVAHSLFVIFCVHIYGLRPRFLLILTQFVD